jgi:hypothetical protein
MIFSSILPPGVFCASKIYYSLPSIQYFSRNPDLVVDLFTLRAYGGLDTAGERSTWHSPDMTWRFPENGGYPTSWMVL